MELIVSIEALCKELNLSTMSNTYHDIATTAAKENWQYVQFLEELLRQEVDNRLGRSKNTLTKLAGFPVIKTLEQFVVNYFTVRNSSRFSFSQLTL